MERPLASARHQTAGLPEAMADDLLEAGRCCAAGAYRGAGLLARRAFEQAVVSLGVPPTRRTLRQKVAWLVDQGRLGAELLPAAITLAGVANAAAHGASAITRDEAGDGVAAARTLVVALVGGVADATRPPPRALAPAWYRDEVVGAGRENLDADHVERYDAKEDAGATGDVAQLRTLGLDDQSIVVDLGAGTGQFVLAVAPVCARVVAADVSPVMLRRLRSQVAGAGLANVEVVEAGFLSYQHQGRPADVVYSRYALHHLPDFWKVLALQRIRRTLRPGGLLVLRDVVYDAGPADVEERIDAWCATGATEADREAAWSRAELEEHVRDEHSTFTWLLEAMIRRCGFEIESAEHSADGIFARYLARAR